MREILFRGQTRKFGEKVRMNGEKLPGNWVYGGIFPGTGDFSIIYGCEESTGPSIENIEKYVIYSDTVGQYTGLTDKNGKKIFEGDILKFSDFGVYPVWWDEDTCTFGSCWFSDFDPLYKYDRMKIEVIGNIHDNPKLLNEGDIE